MAKVIITGGYGFIGSHVVDKLLENNFEVVVIDNLSTGNVCNIQDVERVTLYKLDIAKDNLQIVFQKEQPDYCIHLAAQTSVAHSTGNPCEDADLNIMSSIKLLQLCKKYGIKKFVAASTAAVYGVPQYLPIDENHPTVPISYYGLSKLTMEKYIQFSNVPYIIFRFANVYGPRQASSQESGVVAIFNNNMLENRNISIFGDGEQIRDFVYVEDIANLVCQALENSVENEVVNYSSNIGISVNKLFEKMSKIYAYSKDPRYLPEREGDIKDSILCNQKAYNLFDKCSNVSLDVGLNELRNSSVRCEVR